jgi:hypothetical protein
LWEIRRSKNMLTNLVETIWATAPWVAVGMAACWVLALLLLVMGIIRWLAEQGVLDSPQDWLARGDGRYLD